jgi:hypothetical protein
MERRDAELRELHERALHGLEHAEELEPRASVRRRTASLRLWQYPARGAFSSWTVLSPRGLSAEGPPTLVREVVWDRFHEAARLTDPMEGRRRGFHRHPTLAVRDAEVDETELSQLMEQAKRISIPVVAIEECPGLDGVTCGLATDGFLGAVRLEWWCDGPREWRDLIAWAGEMQAFLSRCLDSSAAER